MVKVHDISLDPRASIVDVIIDRLLVENVQVDSGSSVNLMSFETILELDLTKLKDTPIILRMGNQSRVKPLGMLSCVITTIGNIDFEVTYIVFKVIGTKFTYSILLEQPWLKNAQAKDD